MIEREIERLPHSVKVAFTAHDTPRCDHRVIVWAERTSLLRDATPEPYVHVTYTWTGTALLGQHNTQLFADTMLAALARGEELRKELAG